MEKTIEKDLLILALSSGEHIIAEVGESNGAYICTNALQILSELDQETGQFRFGAVPYLPFADQDGGIAIPTNMASVAIPSSELKSMYSQRFGLVYTPPSKIIL